ncbi:AAA+-type ATPase, SpoVK/Ycf46/Vps4 family [Lentzea waywayandensis]|uniref:AAA+-type ATPase, SpoVK/Ycf46/Vps4 family n=1 Tax=Lentzea waywayandensis TaxID=84724 RepID=A0A1I6DHD1_9PSEU|nr:AAA family ATPase [Lentzea waywayandensis]SFR04791.1 AAA+-type ATPase, SpoVK/Ycf46/Vps4 family [Lentzea waywayandensis]
MTELPARWGGLATPEGIQLLIVHGLASYVSDLFLGEDMVAAPLQDVLWRYLHDQGYERILFSRRSEEVVYCLDEESAGLLRPPRPAGAVRPPGPLQGMDPMGLRRRAEPVRTGLTEQGGIDLLAAAMNDGRARTAVVFLEAEQWLTHNAAGGVFGDVLTTWLEAPRVAGNLCLLVFRQRTLDEVRDFVHGLRIYPALTGLVTALQEHGQGHRPGLLILAAPQADELERLVQTVRLTRGLEVDWPRLDIVVRAMVASRESLRSWRDRLDALVRDGVRLTPDVLRERRWVPVALTDGRSAEERLRTMVGLRPVKEYLQEIRHYIGWQAGRDNGDTHLLNVVFTGNPGTGKSTVARLVGELYRDIGALPIGHVHEARPSDLVGAYQGHTRRAVERAFEEARGGILLIDEAYGLSDDAGGPGPSFGREAITTLVQLMDRERGQIAVVVAGYGAKMAEFLRSNDGLPRRFPNRIDFPDFEPDELHAILLAALKRAGMCWSDEMADRLAEITERTHATRAEGFGNAGDMENLAEQITRRWSVRTLGNAGEPLDLEDLPEAQRGMLADRDLPTPENLLAELDRMVGLESAKRMFRELVDLLRLNKQRRARGMTAEPVVAPHMLFVGPPGTGKTTVARLVGKLLMVLGLVPRGHVHAVSRSDLVAEWMGQTGPRTREAIQQALGGVLFVDEAYELAAVSRLDQYGQEALAVLLEEMENRRGQFVLVAAGYPEEMRRFLDANPGLASRFDLQIDFRAYTDQELVEVLRRLAEDKGYELTKAAAVRAARWLSLDRRRQGRAFGNARTARKLLGRMTASLAKRVPVDATDEELRLLQPGDVPDD